MTSASHISSSSRRSGVAVLTVIAVALAMLGVVLARTSRGGADAALLHIAGQQRLLSERLISTALLARIATPDESQVLRDRLDAIAKEWRLSSRQLRGVQTGAPVFPPDTPGAAEYYMAVSLQDSIADFAHRAALPNAPQASLDTLVVFQRRFVGLMDSVIEAMSLQWERHVRRLVQIEAACVIVLLLGLAVAAQLAMRPAQEKLAKTVAALAESESRARAVLDTMPDGMFLTNVEDKLVSWNTSAPRILGLTEFATAQELEEVTGALCNEHGIPLGDRTPSRITVESGLPLNQFIMATTDSAGKTRYLSANTRPMFALDGTPNAAVTIFRDVSADREQEEERLAQAEALELQNNELLAHVTEREASDERFRLLFERSTDAHILYDGDVVIDCNDATLRMLHVEDRADLVGRNPADLSPARQPDGRLSSVIAGQMSYRARIVGHHRFEWTYRRDDGSEFPVEVTLTPTRMHGRDVTLAVWHDITERKAVEDALRFAKDAAESANRTKSEFMTRMNHELRTPLTAIIGFSRVLLQAKAGTLAPGAQTYVERILDNGMHLLSLINQILDVAKVEAGRMELDAESTLVDVVVDETLAMLASTAEAKGLTLRREIPAFITPIITDRGKLRQVLINLVGNAIKFTSTGEVLVRVTADENGRPKQIEVCDTGVGIPADRLSKIFDPFEQGDSSTRREFGGTGLGLAIVKTFVSLIGATVDVTSTVGKGTIFTIRLA